jgi:hypothetical protein
MSENTTHADRALTAGSRSKQEVGEDDPEGQERESCHSHQVGVSNVSRPLRFDASDGGSGGDEHCEAKPSEPVHDEPSIHVDPTPRIPIRK